MNNPTPRTCSRCATVVPDDQECPTCLAEFNTRRNPAQMSTQERLAEFNSWFLAGNVPEISNNRVAVRVSELLGYSVHPMDIATRDGRDALRREIVGGDV